jgi:hypothetical protein
MSKGIGQLQRQILEIIDDEGGKASRSEILYRYAGAAHTSSQRHSVARAIHNLADRGYVELDWYMVKRVKPGLRQ